MLSQEPLPLPPPLTLPPQKQTTPSQTQIILSKQTLPSNLPYHNIRRPREKTLLRHHYRTNPIVWCCAILCLIFSLLVILLGVATLIIFLVIKPRNPVFDTPNANLNVIYFDSPEYFNGDFTFIANFSNPNRKLNVRFEYLVIELYFVDSLIAAQALQPFSQKQGDTRLVQVHLISSLVHLQPNHALRLQKQMQSNRVVYNVRGTFRVRVSLGLIHFSYWLHGRCQLEMSSPPTGVLISRSCRTKRWKMHYI